MHSADIELSARAFLNAHSVRTAVVAIGLAAFLVWSSSELLPALEHIMLSIRTAGIDDVPDDVMRRLSETLIPFGRLCSKLMIVAGLSFAFTDLMNRGEWLSHDWDANIKALKQDREQKTKKLDAEIARIETLSEKAASITGAAKDFEILADKIERLKLEVGKTRKTKVESITTAPKTAELFLHKPKAHKRPPRTNPQNRPEF